MGNNTFDTLFSTSTLQMLKVLFPLFPPQIRGNMAIFIRIMEFRHTLQYVQSHADGHITDISPLPEGSSLLDVVLPYCNSTQKSEINRLKQTFEQYQQMQDMMEMASAMKDLFPESEDGGGMDPMQLFHALSGMTQVDNPIPNDQKNESYTFPSFKSINNDEGDQSDNGAMDDG